MKKVLLLLTIFLFPFNVFGYSKYVICGGNTLGIEVNTKGIMVVGFYKINGKYNKSGLKNGDYITHINNEEVVDINHMSAILEQNINNKLIITYNRDNKVYNTNLELIYSDGKYKTGLYVKDSIKGIGTLSYIDPETKIYGALGHEIVESSSQSIVEIKSGLIFDNYITGIQKSTAGSPGSKIAKFNYETKYGIIDKNTIYGIFGSVYSVPDSDLIEVSDNIKIGSAKIKTVLSKDIVEEYDIEITAINEKSKTKNLMITITDQELIEKTGGVIQGMSGSPIIQDGKLIGVLTHVIVDNPITGYGLFITTMLEEGEK